MGRGRSLLGAGVTLMNTQSWIRSMEKRSRFSGILILTGGRMLSVTWVPFIHHIPYYVPHQQCLVYLRRLLYDKVIFHPIAMCLC